MTLARGFDLPHAARRPGPYPVLSSGETAGTHDAFKVKGPGFVIGRATNLGIPTWSEGDFWPLNTVLYASDFHGNDPAFLYRLFQVLDLSGFNSGSVQPMLNRNYIAKVPVCLPPIAEQQAIAEVLGALDDKIAANTQLVDTLHQLASALFQGLRAAPTEPRTYGDLAQIGGGGTPSTKEPTYWDGEVMWAAPSDITSLQSPYLDETPRRITATGLAASSSPLYPAGSILMTSRATIGAFAVNQVPTAVNQGFIVVQPHDPTHKWWLFHEMQSRVPEYINYANGATFLELPRSAFKKLQVRVPERSAVEQFDEKVSPLHALARSLVRESRTLAELRDTLLPRLMDGTMRVKDAEHSAGDVL